MLHLPEGRGREMKVKVEWKLAPVDFRRGDVTPDSTQTSSLVGLS